MRESPLRAKIRPILGYVHSILNETILRRVGFALVRRAPVDQPIRGPFSPDTWLIAETPDRLRIWVDVSDWGVSRGCMSGTYEPAETAFVESHLRAGDRFVDVGANIGWFTLKAARCVGPTGGVIAVEPRRSTYARLAMSIAENGFGDRVESHNCALGALAGHSYIGWDDTAGNPGGTWVLTSDDLVQDFRRKGHRLQEAPVSTLDTLIGERKVSAIKLDVEGAEGLILRGGIETLRRSRPWILSEINFALLPTISKMTAAEYVAFLYSHGYRCHALEDRTLGRELTPASLSTGEAWITVVFVPEENRRTV